MKLLRRLLSSVFGYNAYTTTSKGKFFKGFYYIKEGYIKQGDPIFLKRKKGVVIIDDNTL